ncbi:MAG TPA: hypothetical protein VN729_07525 [Ktedonobacteraceae bacterium]|nr:hypothetical protein [Ktedonobacteraceae bacterium]
MSTNFCDVQAGLQRCNKLALFRCASCGRALCAQHAVRVSSLGRNNRVCTACYRRNYQDKQRLRGILRK